MFRRGTTALAVLIALPTVTLASCHLVGGTDGLIVDQDYFDTQGSGGSTAETGGGAQGGMGGRGTMTTTTTSGAGASGGAGCDVAECEMVEPSTTCREVACVNSACGVLNTATFTVCPEDGGGFCDGAGNCVECVNDQVTPCPNMGTCQSFVCHDADCADGMQNNGETAEDCGGPCGPCGIGLGCNGPSDCTSSICNGVCLSCEDEGCSSTEFCEESSGKCEDKKVFGSCGANDECFSDCCFAGNCALSSFCGG